MLWEFRSGLVFAQITALAAVLAVYFVVRQVVFGSLSPQVVAAVEEQFPDASWRWAEAGGRGDQVVHQITMRRGREMIEVAVTPDGRVAEIEREIRCDELPPAVRDALAGNYPGAAVRRIQEVCRGRGRRLRGGV